MAQQIDGQTVETVADFILGCSQITADCDCSHELKYAYSLEGKLTFSSPVATAEFSKCAGILSAALPQHHLSGFEIAQLEFHHLH